jgi:hypothetical protein
LAERAVLDHREEDRHQDQRMNVDLIIPRTIGAAIGFFFTSRADPPFPQNGSQTQHHYRDRHQFRPEALHGTFDARLFNV